MLPERVLSFFHNKAPVQPGDTLLCAVSGGPDSTALLHILLELRDSLGINIEVAHMNHRMGDHAVQHEAFVANMAESLDLTFHHRGVDINALAAEEPASIEALARRERYAFLEEARSIAGAAWILTGHTADDQAETLLLNLLRGAGPRGLGGMLPVGPGSVCRPLLTSSKEEVLAYLNNHGIQYLDDPTNQDLSLTRNKVRRELIPKLESEFNPGIKRVLAREAGLFAQIDEHLSAQGQLAYQKAIIDETDASVTVDIQKLGSQAVTVRQSAIRSMVEDLLGDLREISRSHIDELTQMLDRSSGSEALDLPRGLHVRREYSRLRVELELPRETPAHPRELTLNIAQPGRADWGELAITWATGTMDAAGAFSQSFDPQELRHPLVLRAARPGDRLDPQGMAGSQKLSDLFINRKIPRSRRSAIPVLCDNGGPGNSERILWVVGERRARHAVPAETAQSVVFRAETKR